MPLLAAPARLVRPSVSLPPRSFHSLRSSRVPDPPPKPLADKLHRDLILSVLEANPSARDSRLYLKSFAPPPHAVPKSQHMPTKNDVPTARDGLESGQVSDNDASFPTSEAMPTTATLASSAALDPAEAKRADLLIHPPVSLAESILSAPHQHTGLVKIQGPFTDRQLESIVDGIIYLKKLGLLAIIVVDDEDWHLSPAHPSARDSKTGGIFPLDPRESLREAIVGEVSRLTAMLEARGGETRPILEGVLRLGDGRGQDGLDLTLDNVHGIRSAIEHREIPIIPPIALNSSCAIVCIAADELLKTLAKGLAAAGMTTPPRFGPPQSDPGEQRVGKAVDLTPLRLMIINREGGIPSPARNGHPHLSINLASEYGFINDSFRWHDTHPTALTNLDMARACLGHLPNEASAIIVSHRSPKSLIANLITNKPAHSPSLQHAILLNHGGNIGPATPTLIRKGLSIQVVRGLDNIDEDKLTGLLEASFRRTLDRPAFFRRLARSLRFAIIAGDYQGAAIVTDEQVASGSTIAYLDKFAVLPSLQGEGVVDFLWGALRDESFGLGCPDALNNNGGLGGKGNAVDLVWRSRSANPVNRWYWERSSGFVKIGTLGCEGEGQEFSMFWCYKESEKLLQLQHGRIEMGQTVFIEPGKIGEWCESVKQIPTSWVG